MPRTPGGLVASSYWQLPLLGRELSYTVDAAGTAGTAGGVNPRGIGIHHEGAELEPAKGDSGVKR